MPCSFTASSRRHLERCDNSCYRIKHRPRGSVTSPSSEQLSITHKERVTLTAITVTNIIVSYLHVKSLQLNWRSSTCHLRMPDFQRSCRDLTAREVTRVGTPVIWENAFENIVCETLAILSWPQCVKITDLGDVVTKITINSTGVSRISMTENTFSYPTCVLM